MGLQPDYQLQQECEIWLMNWPAVEVFCECVNEWKFDAAGRVKAIDRTALAVIMDFCGVADRREIFADVRCMENAVLEILKDVRE